MLAGAATLSDVRPDPVALLLFGALLIWAENAAVLLPTTATVSPSFMVVMASLAAFDGRGALLGCALVGASGGLILDMFRRRRFAVVVFNCAQYCLAAAAAGWTAETLGRLGAPTVVQYVLAGCAFAGVNIGLVLPVPVFSAGARLRAVWADMAPTVPNYLAFGLLGTLIGELYETVGPVSVVVLVTPLVIARSVFRAFQGLRHAYRRLEVLYGFTEHVSGALDIDTVVRTTLGQVKDSLGVEQVELALLENGTLIRCTIGGSTRVVARVDEPVDEEAHSLELRVMRDDKPVTASVDMASGDLGPVLAARGMTHMMAAPLHGEAGVIGALLVADRSHENTIFTAEELQLLSTLANHVSVAFQNGKLVERLREESLHDSLTGLANRTNFQAALSGLGAHEGTSAVMLMDLDRFKEVNDTLGHESGDTLLCEISRRLSELVGDRGTIARLGGDEFAVLLPAVEGASDATATAEVLLSALEQPFPVGDLNLEVGASIGVVLSPDHGTDAATLLQRADVAMYAAKEARSGVELYDPDHDEYSPRRLVLANELRHAIDRGQLTVHYQPKADLRTGEVTGVEALLRWHHPEYGFVPPDEFIPLAEHTGSIRPLTRWVLAAAISQCGMWRRKGIDLDVAVNLSMRSLLDMGLPEEVENLLQRAGLDPRSLTLEITESTIMADPVRSMGVLHDLSDLGTTLSIDDFGTGYSSLSYLKRMPVGEVKVDRSFVMNMTSDQDDLVIVRSTIDLARNLGLQVVAEGVEDRPTWEKLANLGCDAAQGYYLGRPMPVVQLDRWLGEQRGDETAEPALLQGRR
ncbi:MAG TPA: EAL domain-containing protein [Acidimicrobiales bacterium]|nr:EAL domain-containing protein [Acidimicrobiales bacterium]